MFQIATYVHYLILRSLVHHRKLINVDRLTNWLFTFQVLVLFTFLTVGLKRKVLRDLTFASVPTTQIMEVVGF